MSGELWMTRTLRVSWREADPSPSLDGGQTRGSRVRLERPLLPRATDFLAALCCHATQGPATATASPVNLELDSQTVKSKTQHRMTLTAPPACQEAVS